MLLQEAVSVFQLFFLFKKAPEAIFRKCLNSSCLGNKNEQMIVKNIV